MTGFQQLEAVVLLGPVRTVVASGVGGIAAFGLDRSLPGLSGFSTFCSCFGHIYHWAAFIFP